MKCFLILEDMPDGSLDMKTLHQSEPGKEREVTPASVLCDVAINMLRDFEKMAKESGKKSIKPLKADESCLH